MKFVNRKKNIDAEEEPVRPKQAKEMGNLKAHQHDHLRVANGKANGSKDMNLKDLHDWVEGPYAAIAISFYDHYRHKLEELQGRNW